jgi:hypothetical protein
MSNELLASSQPSTNGAAQQLAEALQLARLALFDLDVWVMGHALTARRRVLSSMWKHAQPRAVLALSTEALKSHLKEGISKRAGGWVGVLLCFVVCCVLWLPGVVQACCGAP